MSTWQGTGAPAAIVEGTLTQFPHVDQGGREEAWEPEVDESWTNLDGDTIEGDRKYRFRGTYTWSALTDALVQNLVAWYNERQWFTWRLHVDAATVAPRVRIVSLDVQSGPVESAQNVVVVEVEATSLVSSIPVPDLSVTGTVHPMIGVAA